MLVLTVAMYAILARLLIILPVLGSVFQAQQTPAVLMTQPVQGESVRGVVQVMGSAVGEGFSSYDLVYSFENSETPNWFSITSANQTVENGVLGHWDTTTITDGDYSLKLVVHWQDGSQQEVILQHILVRNYTASADTSSDGTPRVEITPESSRQAEGGLLQASTSSNPASLTIEELRKTIYLGAGFGVGLILLVGVYVLARHLSRR